MKTDSPLTKSLRLIMCSGVFPIDFSGTESSSSDTFLRRTSIERRIDIEFIWHYVLMISFLFFIKSTEIHMRPFYSILSSLYMFLLRPLNNILSFVLGSNNSETTVIVLITRCFYMYFYWFFVLFILFFIRHSSLYILRILFLIAEKITIPDFCSDLVLKLPIFVIFVLSFHLLLLPALFSLSFHKLFMAIVRFIKILSNLWNWSLLRGDDAVIHIQVAFFVK